MTQKLAKIFVIFFCIFIASCAPKNPENQVAKNIENAPLPDSYAATLAEEKKVQLAIERRKEQTQIRKGDYMMSKNNPADALGFYLPILEKLPDDIVLYKKIANAYFMLKNWEKSYSYFVRVPISELSEDEKNNLIFALFYREDAIDATAEIAKLPLSDEEKVFYNLMIECYHGTQKCLDGFWNYAWSDEKILAMQSIIKNSHKVTPDKIYRNLLIAKQLYEQKMYRLVGMITQEILSENPNYQEAKKMRAFSLYELGKYKDAVIILLEYFEKNPDDMEVIVRLGEAHTHLGDYVNANLYFNNAISAWYSPKTILERRMAYNYAKLGDVEWMTKVLSYLLQEEDVAEDDFAVGITLAIMKNESQRAYSWAYQWMRKFPNSKILTPLYLQSLRLINKKAEANIVISGLPSEIESLPMVQLEKAILLFDEKKYSEAKKIFEELVAYDESLDFGIEAKNYLERIKIEEEKILQESLSGATNSGITNSWEMIQNQLESISTGDDFWR